MTLKQKFAVLDKKLMSIDDKIKQLKEMKRMINLFKKEMTEEGC
jgi:hypothetical protein